MSKEEYKCALKFAGKIIKAQKATANRNKQTIDEFFKQAKDFNLSDHQWALVKRQYEEFATKTKVRAQAHQAR